MTVADVKHAHGLCQRVHMSFEPEAQGCVACAFAWYMLLKRQGQQTGPKPLCAACKGAA